MHLLGVVMSSHSLFAVCGEPGQRRTSLDRPDDASELDQRLAEELARATAVSGAGATCGDTHPLPRAIGASNASQFPLACRNAIAQAAAETKGLLNATRLAVYEEHPRSEAPTIARMIAEKETLDLRTALARNQARGKTENN